jgi:hypothetical protein
LGRNHVALGPELTNGLADGHPADAEHLGNLLGPQATSSRQCAGDDLILDVDVSLLLGSREIIHELDSVFRWGNSTLLSGAALSTGGFGKASILTQTSVMRFLVLDHFIHF